MFVHLGEILAEASRHCDAKPAVSCGSIAVSYAELLEQAQRVAGALRQAGVREGDRVAIIMRKSVNVVAAMTGSMIAGATYVPIDPAQPEVRIRLILDDFGCSAIVTQSEVVQKLPAFVSAGRPAIVDADRLAGAPRLTGTARPSPDDIAFILYTSGSTGAPKGVCIRHRNLLHFVHWCLGEFDPNPGDTFANHTSFSFDISTFDLYVAIAARGRLRIWTEEQMRSPTALVREIEERRISIWYSVPSALKLMLPVLRSRHFDGSSLRYVLFAGEVFPIRELQALMRCWPDAAFYNLYGPTETNVCTYYRVQPSDLWRDTPVPIGRPLPGVQARLVREDVTEVRAGRIGELVIEGPCVTAGYWKDSGSRNRDNHQRGIHATGDLAEWQGEDLVYRGRIDHMVKVDGYRVELGEIESVLALHPAIDEVVVVTTPQAERITLSACYTGVPSLSLVEMKAFCAARVPAYMVPHRLIRLERLPRNANGKIDRLQVAAAAVPVTAGRNGGG